MQSNKSRLYILGRHKSFILAPAGACLLYVASICHAQVGGLIGPSVLQRPGPITRVSVGGVGEAVIDPACPMRPLP